MSIMYCKPPTHNGQKMTYQERRAERHAADAERRSQKKQEPIGREPIFELPCDERRRLRRAEQQGQVEGEQRAAIEERAKKQAEHDATPIHLRRPENIFSRLIAEWDSKSYRPDVARKIKNYRKLETQRGKEIDAEMAERLRQYDVENNPETESAREHWEKASAAVETEEERQEWARLKGLIEGGGAMDYWDQVAPIMQARLETIQAAIVEQAGRQAPLAEEAAALADKQKASEELQVTPDESGEPTKENSYEVIE